MQKAREPADPGQSLIEISGVSKQFRGSSVFAVRDVSFSAARGEIIGLIGENGAGKSTLLRMMATMLSPSSGSVRICGYDAAAEGEAVRRSIGILFGQSGGLYERLSARENILYFARLNGMEKGDAERRLTQICSLLDMEDFLDRRAGTFSTGMRQKTLIARSIIHDPEVLMLDEPSSGLDVTAARNIHGFIEQYKGLNKTIVFSSHDLHTVERIADRVLLLHKGRLLNHETVAGVKTGGSLEERFFSMMKAGKE